MELKSTATFKDLDIDALVETTSFDEFMSNLASGRQDKPSGGGQKQMNEFDKIMTQLRSTEEPQSQQLKLEFEVTEDKQPTGLGEDIAGEALRAVRDRRKRRM